MKHIALIAFNGSIDDSDEGENEGENGGDTDCDTDTDHDQGIHNHYIISYSTIRLI